MSEVQTEEQDTELKGKKHGKFPEMIPYAFCTWFQWLMSRGHSDLVQLKKKGTVLYIETEINRRDFMDISEEVPCTTS